jgi:hypothetical protein
MSTSACEKRVRGGKTRLLFDKNDEVCMLWYSYKYHTAYTMILRNFILSSI